MALFAVEQAVILDGVRRAAPRCPPQRRREITADEAAAGTREGHSVPARPFSPPRAPGATVPCPQEREAAVESQKRRWKARSGGGKLEAAVAGAGLAALDVAAAVTQFVVTGAIVLPEQGKDVADGGLRYVAQGLLRQEGLVRSDYDVGH